MTRVPFSPGFRSMEPNEARCDQSRHAVAMAVHADFLRIPDENCIRKDLVEFHRGQSRILAYEIPFPPVMIKLTKFIRKWLLRILHTTPQKSRTDYRRFGTGPIRDCGRANRKLSITPCPS